MSWTEIVIVISRQDAESLSDALMDEGALSVAIEDADVGTDAEQPLFGEPGMEPEATAWDRSHVIALVSSESTPAEIVRNAATAIGLAQVPSYQLRDVAEQDWVAITQSQFEPIAIGRRIWVVPSWHQAPDPSGLILELDPGMAFGTGSHPTTRLCMEWLESNLVPGSSVLDYGCGSGILSLLADKLKAELVVGVDIDPQAVESARQNNARNRTNAHFELPEEFIRTRSGLTFDVVIANILSGPLAIMAPMLCARLTPDGWLVLSGILAEQADDVIQAYAPYLSMQTFAVNEGWIALAGQKPKQPLQTVDPAH